MWLRKLNTKLQRKILRRLAVLPPRVEDVRNILLIRFSAMGDVLHTTPVISAVQSAYPDSSIYYLVDTRFKDILSEHPQLQNIITVNRKKLKKSKWNAIFEIFRIIRRLRSCKFDLVIDLHGFNETAILSYITGSPYRLGKTGRITRFCYNIFEFPIDIPPKHPLDQYQNLLKPLGVSIAAPHLKLHLTDEDRTFAREFLKVNGMRNGSPLLAFNLGGSTIRKRWDPAKWAELAENLIHKYCARIILITGPGERHLAFAVQDHMRNPANTTILQTSIRKCAAVLEKANLLISTDSGPLHMGVAVGIPTVALLVDKNRGNFRSLATPQLTISRIRMHVMCPEEVLSEMKDFISEWIQPPVPAIDSHTLQGI